MTAPVDNGAKATVEAALDIPALTGRREWRRIAALSSNTVPMEIEQVATHVSADGGSFISQANVHVMLHFADDAAADLSIGEVIPADIVGEIRNGKAVIMKVEFHTDDFDVLTNA